MRIHLSLIGNFCLSSVGAVHFDPLVWLLLTSFYLEGIPAIVIAPLAWMFLPQGPGKCRFLTPRQNEIVHLRALSGRGYEENGKLNFQQIFAALFDYKNYFQAAIIFCLNVRD